MQKLTHSGSSSSASSAKNKKKRADLEMGRTRPKFITAAQKRKTVHEGMFRAMKADYDKHPGSSLLRRGMKRRKALAVGFGRAKSAGK